MFRNVSLSRFALFFFLSFVSYLRPLSDVHGIVKITVVEVEKSKTEVIGGLAIHPLRVSGPYFYICSCG